MKTIKEYLVKATQNKILWPIIAIALILIFNFFFTPGFFRIQIKNGYLFGSIMDIINRSAPLIIMSIGMTLVIATEGIDISVGAVAAVSGAVACSIIAGGEHIVIALVVALIASLLCGLWNGLLVAKLGIQPMVGTLILMTVGRGIAQLITKGQIITVSHKTYSLLGSGTRPYAILTALFIAFVLLVLLRKTAFGLFIESVGVNKEASIYAGIKSSNIILIAYMICGLFSGIAGILISSNVTAADANNTGLWMEVDAILATVIGGTSMTGGRTYIGGTILGALFIQSLTTTIYALGVPPEVILVVKAFVVIFVSLLQSSIFRQKLFSRMKTKKEVAL